MIAKWLNPVLISCYLKVIPRSHSKEEYNVARQAYAGLLWTKQLFYYDVNKWLDGKYGKYNKT